MSLLDMSTLEVVCTGLGYPEGPVAMDDGSVLLVEIEAQCLSRIAPDGTRSVVAKIPGGPNGAAIGPDGRVWVCNSGGFDWGHSTFPVPKPDGKGDQTIRIGILQAADYAGGSIQAVDLQSGEVETVYTSCDRGRDLSGLGPRKQKPRSPFKPVPLKGPDDLVFDGRGGFWFSDYGKNRGRDADVTGVFYAKADGSGLDEAVFPLASPNGVALSPDARRLYVALTFMGQIWYFELDPDDPSVIVPNPATLDGSHLLTAAMPGQGLLDSIAVDEAGNVWVATMLTKLNSPMSNGGVTVVSPEGEVLQYAEIALPDFFAPFPSNLCFGGEDRQTVYITCGAAGLLLKARSSVPGLKLAYG